MDFDDFSQLTEFVFDQSTPESEKDDAHIEDAEDDSHCPPSAPRPSRVIRRRARRACVTCHRRKVRCDVLSRGHTCTNCRLDGISCVIRSSGKPIQGELLDGVSETSPAYPIQTQMSDLPLIVDTPADTLSAGLGFDVDTAGIVPSAAGVNTFAPDQSNNGGCPMMPANPFSAFNASAQPKSQSDMMFSYYDFLEAESLSHVDPEDFKFLEYKGCFHLPSRPILDDLVREYFLHVHPALPLVDECGFWEAYLPSTRRRTTKKIPLFLFRTMLFASCSFASDETIRHLGFQRTIEARTYMYQRAKLLYDFDTTSDPITLSQGALLLTHYCSDREPMANTTWLQLAIQYAHSVHISSYDKDPTLSTQERLVRKRLWWCLVLRDRILPLGLRRSIQITRDHADFSQSRLCERDLEHEFETSCVYDRETKRDLAHVLFAQIDLAVELTDVISLMYPLSGFRAFDRLDYNTMMSAPPKIKECKDSLDAWYAEFGTSYLTGSRSKKHKSVSLYSGLIRIYLQSARAALCQYESFMLQAYDETVREARMKQLGSALHSSVTTITETVRELVQLDVAKYLPVSAIAYIALPVVLNSLDLQNLSSMNSRTETKKRQLRLLNTAMHLSFDRYTGAAAAHSVIKKTIEAARLEQDATYNQLKSSNSLTRSAPIGDWFETFVSKPIQYLRMSFTIDLSLSVGHYPENKELPRCLSLHVRLLPSNSIPKSLMPCMDMEPSFEDIDSRESAEVLKASSNSHLDYFNLSEP